MQPPAKNYLRNAVYVDSNNIIHVVYVGAQNKKTVLQIHQELLHIMQQEHLVNGGIKIYVDLSRVTYASSDARQLTKAFLTDQDYDFLAIKTNHYLQPLVFFVLHTTKTKGDIRCFNSEKRAVRWLNQPGEHTKKTTEHLQSHLQWALVPILVLTLTGTYIAWQQTKTRMENHAHDLFISEVTTSKEALQERLRAYVDSLYGFRGLFHSSDYVNEREFQDYYASLDLQKNYPGISGVSYVARVQHQEQAAFINQVKKDNSLKPQGRPTFTIKSSGQHAEYFPITYSGTGLTAENEGVDLGTSEERKKTFNDAMISGQPAATASIELIGSTLRKGFLLSIPVYKQAVPQDINARSQAIQGYVNAVFDYNELLKDTLKSTTNDIAIILYDQAGNHIYQKGSMPSERRSTTVPISVSGQTWNMEVAAPKQFGISRSEAFIPNLIAFTGMSLALFLIIVVWLQNRSRQAALQIVKAMTEDLQSERDRAVETKNKDEAILSSIGDGVFALDKHDKIILFNRAAAKITGYSTEEALGKDYAEILHFRNAEGTKLQDAFIHQAQKGKQTSMTRHTLVIQKSGHLLSVADSAAPIFNAKGRQQGVIVVFRDIAVEEKFELALQAANERFEMIAKATNDAVFDLDLASGIIIWNEALHSEYGYTKKDNSNTVEWWIAHIHPDDAMRIEEELSILIKSRRKTWENEYRFQKADGKYAFVRARSFVQRDAHGEPLRLISSMLDITKQKELEQAKDEFISLVSHQLRTPLTAIRLFTEMLVSGQVGSLTKAQQDYLEKVEISTKRMIQLVADILNISRIELGRLKIDPKPTDVNALIRSHIDEVEPFTQEKGVKITFQKAQGLPLIPLDAILFGQIIHNFLTNAIRYSQPKDGRVVISFTREKDNYLLTVSDNGIGIPTEDQARIFERFFRADNAVKVEGEGTGLGLYLIKLVTQSSGGTIRFESKEGKGTTFYITIPLNGMNTKKDNKSLD